MRTSHKLLKWILGLMILAVVIVLAVLFFGGAKGQSVYRGNCPYPGYYYLLYFFPATWSPETRRLFMPPAAVP